MRSPHSRIQFQARLSRGSRSSVAAPTIRLIWASSPLVMSATEESWRNGSIVVGVGRTPAVEVATARS